MSITFLQKKVGGRICLSPTGMELGSTKDWYVSKYYIVLKYYSRFTFWLNAAKITCCIKKNVQIKVEDCISYKKVSRRPSLSSPGVAPRGSKDWYVSNIIMYWNGKVDSFLGWRLSKLPIISKNCSNKSCWEINFFLKSQWTHISISARGGVRGLERSMCFKYLLYWNGEVVLLSDWVLPMLPIISENASN